MKYRSALKIGSAILLAGFMIGAVFIVLRIQRHRSAKRILNKMAAVYKNCDTYQDSGTGQLITKHLNVKAKFNTSFIRPNCFRFEYTTVEPNENIHLIIWRKGTQVAGWWNLDDKVKLVEAPVSFNGAITAIAGVSSGAGSTIPTLLFSKSEIKRPRLTDMTGVTQLDDARLGDIDCYRVKGNIGVLNTVVWIDKSTFLVLKIERITDRGARIVTNYNPIINVEIPDAALEYNLALSQR